MAAEDPGDWETPGGCYVEAAKAGTGTTAVEVVAPGEAAAVGAGIEPEASAVSTGT